MKKKNLKKLIAISTALVLMFSFNIMGALAVDDFSITSGGISVSSHSAGFTSLDTWEIDQTGTALESNETDISVEDLTGTNSGWIFTISFSDFTETGIDDPSVAEATLSVNVDVEDWLSINLKDSADAAIIDEAAIPATNGQDIPTTHYTVDDTIVGSGDLDILEVEPGYGAGLFDFEIDSTITLVDTLPVGTTITSSAESGEFSSGDPVIVDGDREYQIFVGTYETTITFSVDSNPT